MFFLIFMADSATDASVREVEDVCFLKDGEVVNEFAGLKSCSNAKVLGMTEVVNSKTTDVCENWKEKAVALGSGGAY